MTLDLMLVRDFAIALSIGALMGVEREKRKERDQGGIGGLRTFILFAEAGALAAWLSVRLAVPWIFVAVTAAVVALVIAGYFVQARATPTSLGLTTEMAALITYLLGAATLYGYPEVAVVLAIVTSALLAFKAPLHDLVQKIGTDDLVAGFKLLFATFIVLPLLPNHTVDPWDALNPYKLWWLVILISGLSLAGYVAVRWLGGARGTALTGFFGGLVSSTAVTLSFARRSKEASSLAHVDPLAAGILLAWTVMFGRVLVEVGVVNSGLVVLLLPSMLVMGLVGAVSALVLYRRSATTETAAAVPLKNPFNLTAAVKFGAFFAVILLAVKLTQTYLPGRGLYLIAILAGTTDVDAITLSMANLAEAAGNTGTDTQVALRCITLAVVSNSIVKCGMVLALATTGLKIRIAIATGALLVGAAVSVLV